jgi:hypothetical protein
MRGLLSGVGVMLILALTLLLPAAAQGESRGLVLTGFQLKASNGYRFIVVIGKRAEAEGRIGIVLGRGKHTIVGYSTPATVTPTTVDADLGELGRISVTRVPSGRTKLVNWGCNRGETKRIEAQRYEGTIEFHGEEGFAEVSATSAPLVHPKICVKSVRAIPDRGKPGAHLEVDKRSLEGYRIGFDATQVRAGAGTTVSVEVEEHRGELEIFRSTSIWAGPSALSYDWNRLNATVRPPAPFAGHAIFHENAPSANEWTGNLTVDLPGRADVPITGPGSWEVDLEGH